MEIIGLFKRRKFVGIFFNFVLVFNHKNDAKIFSIISISNQNLVESKLCGQGCLIIKWVINENTVARRGT